MRMRQEAVVEAMGRGAVAMESTVVATGQEETGPVGVELAVVAGKALAVEEMVPEAVEIAPAVAMMAAELAPKEAGKALEEAAAAGTVPMPVGERGGRQAAERPQAPPAAARAERQVRRSNDGGHRRRRRGDQRRGRGGKGCWEMGTKGTATACSSQTDTERAGHKIAAAAASPLLFHLHLPSGGCIEKHELNQTPY